MFTGIIESVGLVRAITPQGGDVRVTIQTTSGQSGTQKKAMGLSMHDVHLGDSIATNGICLTVVEMGADYYVADVSGETLRRTTLGQWKAGTRVNLEKALLPTTRLGGHIVSGHVDGLGEIIVQRQDARSLYFEVRAPRELARYLSEKGSVTVDGISLTINQLSGATLSLNLVPHTANNTTISDWKMGSLVNLEVDVLARYLERLMLGDRAADTLGNAGLSEAGVTMSLLQDSGFLNRR
ncbi:MAG: riboflavin synthase [Candidatus Saccharibacteria bacterium]|nr:riboflavin synthase [Moraxellaceae bacterium]